MSQSNRSMKYFSMLFLLLVLMLCSCSNGSRKKLTITIDNPGNTEILIMFDSEEIKVPPKSYTNIAIDTGKHILKYQNLDTTFSMYKEVPYLLNPTLATYYKEEVIFVKNPLRMEGNTPEMKYIPINLLIFEDSIPVVGPYEEITNTLLIHTYDYGIYQSPPKRVESENNQNVHKIRLFRKIDFLKKLAETNEVLKKKFQVELLKVVNREKAQTSIDYFEERKKIISERPNLLTKSGKERPTRISMMEINTDGLYSTVMAFKDSTAIFLSSNGYLIKHKLTPKSNKKDQTLISALSFAGNAASSLSLDKEQAVDQFNLPQNGEVVFHTWYKNVKYSRVLPHDELIKNSMVITQSNFDQVLYAEAFNIIKILKEGL